MYIIMIVCMGVFGVHRECSIYKVAYAVSLLV